MEVFSIFYTVQGEGPFAGRSSVFVRLFGCSLACSWCDTDFESQKEALPALTVLGQVKLLSPSKAPPPLIVITGGEPMRQSLAKLVRCAIDAGHDVQIETAGVHWEPELAPMLREGLSIVCSPKTPALNPEVARHALAFKYIVSAHEEFDAEDGLPARAVSQRGKPNHGRLYRPNCSPSRIFVQPLDEQDERLNKENVEHAVTLVKEYGYRLSLQQHKLLGLP